MHEVARKQQLHNGRIYFTLGMLNSLILKDEVVWSIGDDRKLVKSEFVFELI